ncbi:MAG: tRNA (N(6)-L-threonylcarbamoyladenosine(37)-C(2))-methylthiotransferase MtaB [Lachnospiraceae bacterium]|nr:tRNA (N(6)-L-threonylcarbamoyladenosine(37)-C(2))-methylthiotransferase MtaB [Lachnospiraceae bacterium]
MKSVAFHNLGCKVNDYETDIMQQKFAENGFKVVPFTDKADIYVINTCTVTNIADRKSRQMLHRAKAMNPGSIVIAVGCYVQTDTKRVIADEAVDIAIGNNQKANIINILNDYLKDNSKNSAVLDINEPNMEYESMMLSNTAERTRAYIKIQDGCNQFCTYCLIPYARGRVRSRDKEDILTEIKILCEKGYKEFVLTGIHVSSYGITTANDLSKNKLADLLESIQEIEEVKRIRLSSLEPRVVTEDFAKRISKLSKLCPHFHLSLQSGCDETLKRMNRHYTKEEYLEGVKLLRKYFDDPAITTDIIVGFPGETEEEFKESYDFAKEVGFYEMHIFKYSKRKGTPAEKFPNQVSDQDKDERSDKMIALGEKLSKEFRERHIGKASEVLYEESKMISGKEYQIGHTPEYIKVARFTDEDLRDKIVKEIPKEFLKDDILLV